MVIYLQEGTVPPGIAFYVGDIDMLFRTLIIWLSTMTGSVLNM